MRRRKSLRLKSYDYSSAGLYFITTITHQRLSWFGKITNGQIQLSSFGQIALEEWHQAVEAYPGIQTDEFVIMPNHFHAIVEIVLPVGGIHESPLQMTPLERRRMLLGKIVGRFKMKTSKRINALKNTQGQPFWQENYHEHIVRDEESLNRIRTYIINNPAKWEEDRFNPGREDS